MDSETSLQETSAQLVTEPMSQQNTTFVPAESKTRQAFCSETLVSGCPPDQTETNKEHNPCLVDPACRDMPRPAEVKKAKNQRRRRKQQLTDGLTSGSDKIVDALMVINDGSEERSRRKEVLKRRRYEILDQRYEEKERMAREEHAVKVCIKRTQIVKDFKYIMDELLEAYNYLESINQSSLMIPRERFKYERKREWVEILERQYAEIKLFLATTTPSPEAQPPPLLDNED